MEIAGVVGINRMGVIFNKGMDLVWMKVVGVAFEKGQVQLGSKEWAWLHQSVNRIVSNRVNTCIVWIRRDGRVLDKEGLSALSDIRVEVWYLMIRYL